MLTPCSLSSLPQVRIYSPARSACQQGMQRTAMGAAPSWRLEFETQPKWTNPLMGWTSTSDPLENLARSGALVFYTKEEAMFYCDAQGWQYSVDEPAVKRTTRTKRYSGYGDNFRCAVRRNHLATAGVHKNGSHRGSTLTPLYADSAIRHAGALAFFLPFCPAASSARDCQTLSTCRKWRPSASRRWALQERRRKAPRRPNLRANEGP